MFYFLSNQKQNLNPCKAIIPLYVEYYLIVVQFSQSKGCHFISFVVKALYIGSIHKPIGTVDTPRTPRALEVVGSIPDVSVT